MAVKTEKELPAGARNSWLKAMSAMELKNYGYTITLLQSILRETPEFLQGRQLLRRAAIGNTKGKKKFLPGFSFKGGSLIKKDPLIAIEEAEKILETDPSSTTGNRLLKEAAIAAEMPETAAFALETLHEANPKDTKVLHELAAHYYQHGHAQKAIDAYNKILEITPSDIAAVKGSKDASAKLSMQSGGWETAKDYRDLIKDKEEAVLLEQKSRVVRSEDMIENQLAELAPVYEQDPNNLEVVRKIAALYEQKNDLVSAISYYQWGAQLTNNADAAILRKVSDLQLRMNEQRIAEIENWITENGESAAGATELLAEAETLKKQASAMQLDEAKKRVERNPTDLHLRFELAELLFRTEHFTEAIPELQKARQNPNVRLKAINLLGQCMVKKGMYDLAANQFREAADELSQMDSLKKELLYNLGLTYEHMGDKEKYIDAMKKIYEVDFGYRDVAKRVEESYSKA